MAPPFIGAPPNLLPSPPSYAPPVSANPVLPPPSYAPPGMTPPSFPGGLPYATVPAGASAAERAAAALQAFKRPPAPALGLGRLLPYGLLALPVLIPYALEPFAPGVQDWLKGGWKGRPGYGIPGITEPGLIPPGSRPVLYDVFVRKETYDGACNANQVDDGYRGRHIGPISQIEGRRRFFSDDICRGGGDSAVETSIVNGEGDGIVGALIWSKAPRGSLTVRAVPVDGRPEGVPDPSLPGVERPYPPTQNPREGESPYLPRPQRPSDPRETSPSPLPDRPFPQFAPNEPLPGRKPALPPQVSPNPSVAPVPSPGSAGNSSSRPPALPPATSAPSPPERPPEASEECNDPCSLRIAKGMDFLKDKIDDALKKKDDAECPPCPEVPSIVFPVVTTDCNNGNPRIKTWQLILREQPPSGLAEALDAMASLAAKACQTDAAIAFPDWWQVRIGAERPQIVITYRSGGTSDYRSLSLPHPIETRKWSRNLLGNYQAGPVHGILTLKDNSKFVVNCSSEAEANRMIAIAKTLINPSMLDSTSKQAISRKEGRTIAERVRVGTSAAYFPTGQRDFSPAWKAVFNPDI